MTNPKTKNLELNLIDRTSPTTTYLNLQTNLDDNWEKIDQALGSETVDAEPIPVTLKQGMQVVNNETNRKVPLQLKSLKGRTLVNLLGRDGGCESIAPFATGGAMTLTLDASNKTTGSYGIKATNVTPTGTFWRGSIPIKRGKYYITLADLKNGTADNIFVRFPKSQFSTPAVTDSSKFQTVYVKYAATVDDIGLFDCVVTGDAGEYAYVDSIRIYEISQAEYNALDSMTADQIAAKYPYVDDMKPIVNPYVIRYGKNLLPPFTQWITTKGVGGTPRMELSDTYTGTLVADENLQALAVDIPIVGGQTYTLSVPSLPSGGWMGVNSFDVNGTFVNAYGGYGNETTKTFTLEASVVRLKVLLSNNTSGGGSFTFINPMLNIGPEPLPFVPREDNMQVAVTSLASNVDGSVYDELYQKEGRLYKFGRFKTIDLDGSLPWVVFSRNDSEFKEVKLDNFFNNAVHFTEKVVKYDGKILGYKREGVLDLVDIANFGDADADGKMTLWLTIANTDSGWGKNYTPTADEIKAYFNGWKMCVASDLSGVSPYNGEGTKAWVKRRLDGTYYDGTTILPRDTYSDFLVNFGYYKLQYQLATPTLEEVPSEGQISLHEGANQVEAGVGMIVREKAIPVQDAMNPDVYINVDGNKYSNVKGSELSFRADRILNVFDETNISKFSITHNTPNAYGNDFAIIPAGLFDNSKPYSVTYTVLDKYLLTGPVSAIDCQFPSNIKTIVNDLVSGQVDVVRRVGVLEMQKAGSYQPQWITPTLLNGWVNYSPSDALNNFATTGYYKDEQSIIRIKGFIKGDAAMKNAGTVLFVLPPSYRPKGINSFACMTYGSASGTGREMTLIQVKPSGEVLTVFAVQNWISMSNIIFRAEQ